MQPKDFEAKTSVNRRAETADDFLEPEPQRQERPPSHNSHSSQRGTFLVRRGDYRNLLSYQKTAVIYPLTYRFCQRFLDRGDRTKDQMIQAARSAKQNIVEGSKAALTSKETEIKLTNVARASLEELLEDYLDFLQTRGLRIWEKDSKEAHYARDLGVTSPLTYGVFEKFAETRSAEVVANLAVCLINQANYLLDRQTSGLEAAFLRAGGVREQMTRARLGVRSGAST